MHQQRPAPLHRWPQQQPQQQPQKQPQQQHPQQQLWVLLLRLRLLLSPALGLAHVLRCLRLQLLTWGPC